MPSQTDRHAVTNENIFAEKDSADFGIQISARVKDLTRVSQGSAFALHYMNAGLAYQHLYGLDVDGVGANAAVITRSGEQGSIAEMRIPAAAGQLRKVWNIIVGPELAWTAVATTTDYASEAQAVTAKNALQYYWADKGVSTLAKAQALEALSYAEGAIHIPWNEEMGDDLVPEPILDENGEPRLDDEQQPMFRILKTGDIDYRPVSTWDLIRDPTAKSYEALPYIIIREWQNKHDVSARCKNPKTAADALTQQYQPVNTDQFWRPFSLSSAPMSELIPVYYCYHKRTSSVPQGRQTEFLENGSIISDGPLDKAYWKELPVVRMASGEYSGTPFPYSKFFAVLGSAQAADGLMRDLLTNATATSGGIIVAEDDSNTPPLQLGGGPKVLYFPKGAKKPEPLILQQSHPESFALVKTLRGESQQILGLDNLTAGQEIGSNLSGAAMALMTSTSVQNNSQEQAAWGQFVQRIGNVTLAHIQHHMKEPRKIALAGKSRADLVITTELSGSAVEGIDRLQVQLAPALQQTTAGKMEIAEQALKQGWARTPAQLQSVYDTGRLDALTQGLSTELMLISSENEVLAKGEDVPVMASDNHVLHLSMDGGHPTVTASARARQDPKVVEASQRHMAQHIDFLVKTDPKILALFGQPSLAAPPPMQADGPSEATKLGAASLAVKQGWASTPQAAQKVFESGKLDANGAMPPPAMHPAGVQVGGAAAEPGTVPGVKPKPFEHAASTQTAGNPAVGSAASPQQRAQVAAPALPANPRNGAPTGPVAGTVSPSLAIRPSGR